MKKFTFYIFCAFIFLGCQPKKSDSTTSEWQTIFNGKDLTGWTPKIAGYEVGNNFGNTFRVEDGILKVDYSEYPDSFDNRFGHLFYKNSYSDYHLKVEYRFVGEQKLGEGEELEWAFKNSGVMFHAQSAESMRLNQGFPVSLEGQFLGGNGEDDRPTANLCTPGINVYLADTLTTNHCISSDAPTFHGEEWVNFEIIVHHDSIIHHIVNGDTVISYTQPTIGGGFLPENYPDSIGTPVKKGYFALQSESHPVEFRKVELLDLGQH
jgi:hypothetical protein